MTTRSSSHPPPRNTSRTAQKATKSLRISYRSTYIYKEGADISLGLKYT